MHNPQDQNYLGRNNIDIINFNCKPSYSLFVYRYYSFIYVYYLFVYRSNLFLFVLQT